MVHKIERERRRPGEVGGAEAVAFGGVVVFAEAGFSDHVEGRFGEFGAEGVGVEPVGVDPGGAAPVAGRVEVVVRGWDGREGKFRPTDVR